MKKSKLIALLNSIEGDPDIVFWNGFVGDYQDISPKLIGGELVKRTLSDYLQHVEFDRARRAGNWELKLTPEEITECKKLYKQNFSWEINGYVTKEDIVLKRYTVKNVLFLQPKQRGVETFDRMGTIRY